MGGYFPSWFIYSRYWSLVLCTDSCCLLRRYGLPYSPPVQNQIYFSCCSANRNFGLLHIQLQWLLSVSQQRCQPVFQVCLYPLTALFEMGRLRSSSFFRQVFGLTLGFYSWVRGLVVVRLNQLLTLSSIPFGTKVEHRSLRRKRWLNKSRCRSVSNFRSLSLQWYGT